MANTWLKVAAYGILWEENFPDQPIDGGYHLVRFARNTAIFISIGGASLRPANGSFPNLRWLCRRQRIGETRQMKTSTSKSSIFRLPATQKKRYTKGLCCVCTTEKDGKTWQLYERHREYIAFTASAGMQNTVKPYASGIGNKLDENSQRWPGEAKSLMKPSEDYDRR